MIAAEVEQATIIDDFVKTMKWSDDTPEDVKTLVIGNLRGFWSWMHSQDMEGCQSVVDQALAARFREGAIVRGIPVWVCADEFEADPATGLGWGPGCIWAIRRDDGTAFELTSDDENHWAGIAAEKIEPYDDDPSW